MASKAETMRRVARKKRLQLIDGRLIAPVIITAYKEAMKRLIIEITGVRKISGDFNYNVFNLNLSKKLLGRIEKIYKRNLIDIDTRFKFEIRTPQKNSLAAKYIRKKELLLKGLSERESNRMRNFIATETGQGLTGSGLVNSIKEKFPEIARKRARGLARNLVGSAHEEARSDFWNEAAPDATKKKEWLPTIGGEFDREHHNEIGGGSLIDANDMFSWFSPSTLSTVSAMFPQDSNLPDGESINCGCTTGYEIT